MRNLLGHEKDDRYAHPDSQFAALVTGNSPSLLASSAPMSSSLTNARAHSKSATFQSLHGNKDLPQVGIASRSPSPAAMRMQRSRSSSEIASTIKPKINSLELYYSHFAGLQVIQENIVYLLQFVRPINDYYIL